MPRVALASVLACVACAVLAPASPAATETPAASGGACETADTAHQRGQLERAEDAYLDVLARSPDPRCAVAGLITVRNQMDDVEKLCRRAAAKAVGDEAEKAAARKLYVEALELDAESACATKGLTGGGGGEADEEGKSGVKKAEEWVGSVASIAATGLIALLVLVGTPVLVYSLWKRWRRPSLTVQAFADGAVEAKVGAAVAALAAKRLTELSRRDRPGRDAYQLDLVVADVELMAESESLATAMGGLAEESQFKLAAAVLGLIDRFLGTHLVAKGELAPLGGEGRGLLLALQSQRKGLKASGALWNPRKVAVAADGKDADPAPYYELADEAAAWIQFEAARALNADVYLLTGNARSFAELVFGIQRQRAGNDAEAAAHYARALLIDRENVAALVNLSVVAARLWGDYEVAVKLLVRAETILRERHEVDA